MTAPLPPDPAALPDVDPYRPSSPRQRLVIVLVTVATVFTLWFLLLYRPGWQPRDLAACRPGETQGCVGGQANVTLIPAPAVASAASVASASASAASAPAAAATASAAARQADAAPPHAAASAPSAPTGPAASSPSR